VNWSKRNRTVYDFVVANPNATPEKIRDGLADAGHTWVNSSSVGRVLRRLVDAGVLRKTPESYSAERP